MFLRKSLQSIWIGLAHRNFTRPPVSDRSEDKSLERVVLLLITQDEHLSQSLWDLGHVYRWEVVTAATCEAAVTILTQRQIPLVICDEDTPQEWRRTVRTIAFLPQSTCILLASQNWGEPLAKEVRKHHGYDAIAKPLRFQEVADRVSFAWAWYQSGCASWWGPTSTSAMVPPGRHGES